MKNKKHNKSGFTLVELMVVAIIVAILAAVAIPLMSGNKKRAMATEAEAGIGSIATVLRVYRAENGGYPTAAAAQASTLTGIGSADLDGQFYDTVDYKYTAAVSNYTITATGGADSGRGGDVGKTTGMTTSLDSEGSWTRTGY